MVGLYGGDGYEWVGPAACCCCWCLRDEGEHREYCIAMSRTDQIQPTIGGMSLEGVLPLAPAFDTLGVLARDPQLWTRVSREWYGYR